MKQQNTLLLTFWLVHPEGDRHDPEQMRALGEAGVYAPEFQSGERKMLAMVARFDPDDPEARISAALYAVRNAKLIASTRHPGCRIWGVEVHLNGQKLTSEKISTP